MNDSFKEFIEELKILLNRYNLTLTCSEVSGSIEINLKDNITGRMVELQDFLAIIYNQDF